MRSGLMQVGRGEGNYRPPRTGVAIPLRVISLETKTM
jgi:hypothetical protein